MSLLRLFCRVSIGLPALLASCAEPSSDTAGAAPPILIGNDGRRIDPTAGFTPVPNAITKVPGATVPNALSPELFAAIAAQGADRVENPQVLPVGAPEVSVTHYGYDSDGPLLPAPGDVPSATHQVEATKTEPDKNTYLVLRHQSGPIPTTTTAPTSCSRATRTARAAPGRSPGSTSMPMLRIT